MGRWCPQKQVVPQGQTHSVETRSWPLAKELSPTGEAMSLKSRGIHESAKFVALPVIESTGRAAELNDRLVSKKTFRVLWILVG